MGKRLTPYEKVDNFITKNYDLEVDKWNSGISNNMEEWEHFLYDWKVIDDIAYYKETNAELRMYNERLKDDNSKLSYKNQKLIEDMKELKKIEFDNHITNIDELIQQLESLKDEAIYMMRTPNVDEVFSKDFHALSIVIRFLEEVIK